MYTYISTKQKPYFNNFNYKEHHKNIYTFINTKIKTLFLTIKKHHNNKYTYINTK